MVGRKMSKAILISIHPQWCDKIADGRKTIEVRKTKPKLKTPFKCYIYMTSGGYEWRDPWCTAVMPPNRQMYNGAQKVIGEFVCDEVLEYPYIDDGYSSGGDYITVTLEERIKMRLHHNKLLTYGDGKTLYGWHISEVKIYDAPKELSEFETFKDYGRWVTWGKVKRAPQSWCYVEEQREEENARTDNK